ncbi:hypothetical protein ACQP04_04405 [Pseudonocardia halophobica]|uniref:hypothetical protein n=1 Tax=Pseudonocardia halophobica TaxID=29401 RepID=UPI003D903C76
MDDEHGAGPRGAGDARDPGCAVRGGRLRRRPREDYTEATEAMFFYTDTADAPWTVIKSNDKKRARLEAIRHVLGLFGYPGKDPSVATPPDPLIVGPAASAFEAGEGRAVFPPPAVHPPR